MTDTNAPALAAAELPPGLMEMFVIITVQHTTSHSFKQATIPGTIKVRPGASHMELFQHVCNTFVPESMRGATVLFYAIHPAVIQ